ncbi:MAG TPA: carbohydrate ABC transporter permease [Thermomicrobiales bacterium]|nr:carbohydrate ABC transporter permease [Thermomicrobiales bacterium]
MSATISTASQPIAPGRRFDPAMAASHAVLVVACLAILLPVIWTARTSLTNRNLAYDPGTIIFQPTLENYAKIFGHDNFQKYFWNSLWIGLASTIVSLVVGSLAAYSIARFRTGGQAFSLSVLGTQMLPPVALVIPFFLLAQRLDLLDHGLALATVYLSFNLPFVVWILIGFFQGIPRELEEAAQVDGAGRFGAFWQIVVPLSLPGLLAAGVFSFVLSWNEFLFALVLTGRNAKTLPVALAGLMTSQGNQIGAICAATVAMMTPIVVLTWVIQRFLVRGLTFGAVK